MVGLVFISLSLLAVCQAGAVPAAPVKCGAIPKGLYRCLAVPPVVKSSTAAECGPDLPECEKITCLFRKSGWMDGDKVDKPKLAAYLDQYAKENPDWQTAVDQTKIACLQADLPAQGIHLNCPTFDIMQCSFTTFIKCEKITCLFRKSGWMDGDKVDKPKLAAYLDQYAKENPDWQTAVDQTKIACLQADLPAQGIHLNCPTFDIMQCSFTTFIKSAQPSKWSSDPSCDSLRQYAAACPVCPSDCFEPQIPVGSCNACLGLPRTP